MTWPAPLPSALPAVETVARLPRGFRAAALAAGIKASGKPDLGVIATTGDPASVAAVFTTNAFPAAPIRLSRANLAASGGLTRAILLTSGCANAATGPEGDRDQQELAAVLGDALEIAPAQTLALSTGLIGTRLPVAQLRQPIGEAVRRLEATDAALSAVAEQMCTTDTRAKATSVLLEPARDGEEAAVTVTGIAKGVGMIHPQMATMLAVLLTDAAVDPGTLREILLPVVERTWNQLTVDGDTSTNDTVFVLASGAASGGTSGAASGGAPGAAKDAIVVAGTPEAGRLAAALEAVARSLARQQAADGEGATTLITVQVSGGRDDREARAVARSIVASSLVKAAVHGRDPNWGRIAAAIGNADVDGVRADVAEDRLQIAIGGVPVFEGRPVAFEPALVSERMAAEEVVIRVELGPGVGVGEAFGCDLSPEYVIENAAYST